MKSKALTKIMQDNRDQSDQLEINIQDEPLYYAFYSKKAADVLHRANGFISYWQLASPADKAKVECTAVYKCANYDSPDEVLKNEYMWDDAKFVGIVDVWLASKPL